MVLEIKKYGDGVLRQKALPVPFVTDDLRKLAADMIETMHKARGVGLAAEQVGRLERMCVIDIPEGCEDDPETESFNSSVEQPMVLFNPVMLSMEGEQEGKEGCLSFPNMSGPVTRANEVTCQYTDPAGEVKIVRARGFLARAIQHELDHLDGILYVDRYDEATKVKMSKRLEKMAKKNGGVK